MDKIRKYDLSVAMKPEEVMTTVGQFLYLNILRKGRNPISRTIPECLRVRVEEYKKLSKNKGIQVRVRVLSEGYDEVLYLDENGVYRPDSLLKTAKYLTRNYHDYK